MALITAIINAEISKDLVKHFSYISRKNIQSSSRLQTSRPKLGNKSAKFMPGSELYTPP